MSEGTTSPDTVTRLLRRLAEAGTLWIDTVGNSIGRGTRRCSMRVVPASRPRRGEVSAMCDEDGRVIVHRVLGWSATDGGCRAMPTDHRIGRSGPID